MESSNKKYRDILIVCGSGRGKAGNTAWMAGRLAHSLRKAGRSIETVYLNERDIRDCDGCDLCRFSDRPCRIDDDMRELAAKIAASKCLVIGSPNYFKNVSGSMKRFMDRTNQFIKYDRSTGKTAKSLAGKPVFGLCVGGQELSDTRHCEEALLRFFKAHDLKVVGTIKARADAPREIAESSNIRPKLEEGAVGIIKALKEI